jgi:hypothetical protein
MIEAQLIPQVFLVEMCAVFFRKAKILFYERYVSNDVRAAAQSNGACLGDTNAEYAIARCQFILLSHTAFEISSLQSSNRCAHLHESYRTLRDGSFGVAPSQALRARLRSCRPSGTKQILRRGGPSRNGGRK